jgi:3-oxoacyl-[acyl-carrier protein] reductase
MLLKDKIAIVTGSSRGIGAAVAIEFARQGAKVAIVCLNNIEAATLIGKRIWEFGGSAFIMRADIRNLDQVNQMFLKTTEIFGAPPNILVNNAFPGFFGGSVIETSWEAFNASFDTIIKGAFNCSYVVLPSMIKNRFGRIINIGSTSTLDLNERHAPYITAKGALLTLTRSLSRDYGKYNVTVNMVSPGLTWSDLDSDQPYPHPSEHFRRTPMNRIATSKDIANACIFYASDLSSFVTGTDLPVCGGMIMQ